MLRDLRKIARRVARGLILSAFLGLACGFAAFYAVYPNMAYPPAGEASLPLLLFVLIVSAIPAGVLTESLPDGILQTFLAIPIAGVVGSVLSVSPEFTGMVQGRADILVYDFLHNGFGLFVLAFFINVVGGIAGMLVREQFIVRPSMIRVRGR